jgi:hypothetical protein
MSPVLAPQRTVEVRASPAVDGPRAVRRFLAGYVGTVLPLVAGAAVLVLAWELLADGVPAAGPRWAAAAVAVTAWAGAVVLWLHRRGRRRSTLHVVAWAGPAAVLAVPAAAGWLSPDGLVLWGPVTSVLAVALAMAERPLS